MNALAAPSSAPVILDELDAGGRLVRLPAAAADALRGTGLVDVRPEGEGVVIGDLDLSRLAEIRKALPALRHRVL